MIETEELAQDLARFTPKRPLTAAQQSSPSLSTPAQPNAPQALQQTPATPFTQLPDQGSPTFPSEATPPRALRENPEPKILEQLQHAEQEALEDLNKALDACASTDKDFKATMTNVETRTDIHDRNKPFIKNVMEQSNTNISPNELKKHVKTELKERKKKR